MKRIIVILAILLITLTLITGCKGQTNSKGKIKIGFLLKTFQEERYKKDKKAFIDRANALGVEVIFDSCDGKANIQYNKFQNMLARGVKVIVLQPVSTGTAGNMVRLAHKDGVRVVGYDSLLQNGPLDVHIMQDSWAVGRLQGKAMINWFKKIKGAVKGNVCLIKGHPGDANAIAMSQGALSIIKANPGLKLIVNQYHERWAQDKATATTQNALTRYKNDIQAFICNNSGLARGVITALREQKLNNAKKVFVAGSDADEANIKLVAKGQQAVEIFKKIKPLAYKAAEVACLLAKNPKKSVKQLIAEKKLTIDRNINNKFADIPTIVTKIVLVNKDNIKSTVIKDGFHTKKAIYGQ